jgi:FAD/FMN-containing dehydrogenase
VTLVNLTAAPDFASAARAILGPSDILIDPAAMAPFLQDWRHMFKGKALAVCLPRTTAQVSALVRLCAAHDIGIVPQGGNTGLAGGATPDGTGRSIVLGLTRMTQIRDIDRIGLTVTAEAGVVIDTLRAALTEQGRDLPISFGATGSATLGGVIATNAGGANVLHAGMTGTMVLGLEVVLADGSVVSRLSGLHKDNSGLNWTQLFVGSEGSLGIITAAVMRTTSLVRNTATALLAVADAATALAVYGTAVDQLGACLTTFEIISADSAARVEAKVGVTVPVASSGWLLLVEAASTSNKLVDDFDGFIEDIFAEGLCVDGTVAASEAQRQAIWRLRESLTEAEALSGSSVKHDISVPVSRIPAFLEQAAVVLAEVAAQTGAQLSPHVFGHIGDGNLHYNILTDRPDLSKPLIMAIHDLVAAFGGSITAEHGVGQYRLDEAYRLLPPSQLDLQEKIKTALDPKGLFNPGKLVRLPSVRLA